MMATLSGNFVPQNGGGLVQEDSSGAMDSERASAYANLKQYLSSRGLGSLFNQTDGVPSGWLWTQLINGVDTESELVQAIETTSEFQSRFGIIFELRKRAAAGENVYVPTVDDVISYEQSVTETLRNAGMPLNLYSSTQQLHSYMSNQLSASEIEDRVIQVWNTVQSASPDIKAEFASIIGNGSDAYFAAYILDPETTRVAMEQQIQKAVVGGTATTFGVDIDNTTRDRLANLPLSEAGFSEGFSNISSNAEIFQESISEVDDLTAGVEGVGMEFEGDAAARTRAEQRVIKRKSIDRAASGGAQTGGDGIAGLRGY
jgi:hypothetical protein